ncbi:class I SAM-dependent methyltransferase [Mumia sp. Pv 4-285]|uniref:class I SAM-dependent methyltransferase n=1 Tax=Mumia qirimensis TaxID=3234852 RepID=UPI00351D44E8
MRWYREQVLPRVIDVFCGMAEGDPCRARVCAGLTGDVVEIGFGSGLNVPFYPLGVRSVAAVEPSDVAWRLAEKRVVDSRVPIRRVGLDGESLPMPDASADAVLSTWTMCTIPDLDAALAECRRVLRPGGTVHFLEHGLAPDEPVRRWQHRLDPLQQRFFGGCHLTRTIPDSLVSAGFAVIELETFYLDGAPRWIAADSLGVAVSAP